MERPENSVDLFDYIRESGRMTESEAKIIFKQVKFILFLYFLIVIITLLILISYFNNLCWNKKFLVARICIAFLFWVIVSFSVAKHDFKTATV